MGKKKSFFDTYDYSTLQSTEPLCEHFGSCGGCRFQNISYDNQLILKKEFLKKLFNREIEVISGDKYNYRNRMDFVYTGGKFGFRKRGDFKTVVDVNKCHLINESVQQAYSKIKTKLLECDIRPYDLLEQRGFLRYVVFRHAKNTNELMVIFTTTSPSKEQEIQFKSLLEEFSELIDSIHWIVYDEITDLSIPPVPSKLIIGNEFITEKINDKLFTIGPQSFFQANTSMSQVILEDIKKEVEGNTVDLCCGVGTIGLFVAEKAHQLIGIEQIPQAIVLAKENMKKNNVVNATFFCDDMKNILDYVPLEVDTLIVDPPRAGLGKKVIKRIKKINPKKIIYMSCNPKTQLIDFQDLEEDYTLDSIKAYDQFPQTPHIETLAILNQKNS